MRRNSKTNALIKWMVTAGDFVLLNMVVLAFSLWHPRMGSWSWEWVRFFTLLCNIALAVGEWRYHTIIHHRLPSGGQVLRRIVFLMLTWIVTAYLLMKVADYRMPVGWLLAQQGIVLFFLLIVARLVERTIIKWYRLRGRNTRTITFVGDDSGLMQVYEQLVNDPTTGCQVLGCYADNPQKMKCLGSMADFLAKIDTPEELALGDELYLSVPHKDRNVIQRVSALCDRLMVKFFFVPLSVESIQLEMTREFINDVEVFTTHESPLENPMNSLVKRAMDILISLFCLMVTAVFFPLIWLTIKLQSPGPVFFKQQRTGLDGKPFTMLKFRSMHVNKESDSAQATEDDPRKFPFGNFMRRTSIDELPQFWNVFRGDMSLVGPRPHMLKHTEMYSNMIDKFMVRHFVKPGMSGWAQVTGYRGETKELWQMEERVRRDIWYIEHWSIWLDLRVMWMTGKQMVLRNKNAY